MSSSPPPSDRPKRGPRAHIDPGAHDRPAAPGHVSLAEWSTVRAERPPVEADLVRRIPLDLISSSAFNPRTSLDAIEELADSLAAHGLLQPVVVRPVTIPTGGGKTGGLAYELVAGHRRTAAARHLGWTDIAALVRETEADEGHILTLVENLQRDELSPREQAAGLERLLRERGWNAKQVAQAIRKSETFVSRRLRVFEDPVLAPYVLTDRIPVALAQELLALGPVRKQNLAEQVVEHGWGRPEIRRAITSGVPSARRPRGLTAQLRRLRVAMDRMMPADFTDGDIEELKRWIQHLRGWATRQRAVTRFPLIGPGGQVALSDMVDNAVDAAPENYQPGDLAALAASVERNES